MPYSENAPERKNGRKKRMSDIAMKFDEGKFRMRGVGIIIRDGKVLMVHDELRKYYYAIGGAVRLGETTEEAAVREVYEESGLRVEPERLALVQENRFILDGELHHEVSFYDLMKDIGDQKTGERVLDYAAEGLVWMDIATLEEHKVFPRIYSTLLKELPDGIVHSMEDEREGK